MRCFRTRKLCPLWAPPANDFDVCLPLPPCPCEDPTHTPRSLFDAQAKDLLHEGGAAAAAYLTDFVRSQSTVTTTTGDFMAHSEIKTGTVINNNVYNDPNGPSICTFPTGLYIYLGLGSAAGYVDTVFEPVDPNQDMIIAPAISIDLEHLSVSEGDLDQYFHWCQRNCPELCGSGLGNIDPMNPHPLAEHVSGSAGEVTVTLTPSIGGNPDAALYTRGVTNRRPDGTFRRLGNFAGGAFEPSMSAINVQDVEFTLPSLPTGTTGYRLDFAVRVFQEGTSDLDGNSISNWQDRASLTSRYGTSLTSATYDARCDYNFDGQIDVVDLQGYLATFEAAACVSDFNSDGTTGVGDMFLFLDRYFAMDPVADMDASGGDPTVGDVFMFMDAYFAPGC